MIIGRYRHNNRPIPIIGKTADTDYRPIISASLVMSTSITWTGNYGFNIALATGITDATVHPFMGSMPQDTETMTPSLLLPGYHTLYLTLNR